jgi:hypothetical protein
LTSISCLATSSMLTNLVNVYMVLLASRVLRLR